MANWVAATDTNKKQVYANIGTAMILRHLAEEGTRAA